MKSTIPLLAVVATFLQGGNCQIFGAGRCPDVAAKYDFDIKPYMGTWYQWGTYGTQFSQGRGKCVKAHYYQNPVTGIIDLVVTQDPFNRLAIPVNVGFAVRQHPKHTDGKLLLTIAVPVIGKVTVPLWILGTDYVSFSVKYTCVDFWLFHFTSAWIMSRDQFPSQYMQDEANTVLQKIKLDISQFKKTKQSGCSKTNVDTNTNTYTDVNGNTYSDTQTQTGGTDTNTGSSSTSTHTYTDLYGNTYSDPQTETGGTTTHTASSSNYQDAGPADK